MATYTQSPVDQSLSEIRAWIVDFTEDLPDSVTVASATAAHTPPSGSASSPTVATDSPLVSAQLGPLTVPGLHYLYVVATLSNGEKASVTIAIPVEPVIEAARGGMVNLINKLRSMTEAGPADYKIAGVSHWSDVLLQEILDGHRTDVVREPLRAEADFLNIGSAEYRNYYSQYRNFEEAASGTPAWDVEDGTGESASTADYSINYNAGHVRFNENTLGISYYLSCRVYNLNGAAAEVWQKKAAHVARAYDFRADQAQFNRSQMFDHYMKMADHYRDKAGIRVTRLFRSDAA